MYRYHCLGLGNYVFKDLFQEIKFYPLVLLLVFNSNHYKTVGTCIVNTCMALKSLEALAPSTADPTSTDSSSIGRTTGKPSRKKYKESF